MYIVTIADVVNMLERKGSYKKETLTIRGDIGYYFVKKPYGLDRKRINSSLNSCFPSVIRLFP
jgi:hypothetical protein